MKDRHFFYPNKEKIVFTVILLVIYEAMLFLQGHDIASSLMDPGIILVIIILYLAACIVSIIHKIKI